MKKAYESPVMMVENFVAHEYVAACYNIICLGMNDESRSGLNTVGRTYDHNHSGEVAHHVQSYNFTKTHVEFSPIGLGWIGKKEEEVDTYTDASGNKHWEVEAVRCDSREHPNASD